MATSAEIQSQIDILQSNELDLEQIEGEYEEIFRELEILFGNSTYEKLNLAKDVSTSNNQVEKIE